MEQFKRFLFLVLIFCAADIMLSVAFVAADDVVKTGQGVYLRYCVGCHGEKGDGKGKAAPLLVVKPRDFTTGIFKFKSTPQGTLPTDEDLIRTITKGLPGNSMPSFVLVPERERRAVIEYIKTFSEKWKKEKPGQPATIPFVPEYVNSPESIAKGRSAYEANGCVGCHGDKGDGKGPAAAILKDMWGNPDKPRNFTRGIYAGGGAPSDLFRTMTTGIEGAPMPSFAQIPENDRWHLISYLFSLKGGKK